MGDLTNSTTKSEKATNRNGSIEDATTVIQHSLTLRHRHLALDLLLQHFPDVKKVVFEYWNRIQGCK